MLFRYIFILSIFLIAGSGCKSLVEVQPPKQQIEGPLVFTSDATANAAVIAIYAEIIGLGDFMGGSAFSIFSFAGMSADELENGVGSADLQEFADNEIRPANGTLRASLWQPGYKYIYYANSIIERLATSKGVSAAKKAQLEGEAKFLRAFFYFYLTNLFGDVPLVLSTDYRVNALLPRASRAKVYEQIVADLISAQELLPDDYPGNGERIRANKGVATAMLARVYLFTGNWMEAERQATAVIDENGRYRLLDSINDVFLKDSEEAIWQMKPAEPSFNTWEGYNLITHLGGTTQLPPRPELLAAFEEGDRRREKWFGNFEDPYTEQTYTHVNKYKVREGMDLFEYSILLRLGEQYLIRAEARVRQNNFDGARDDIDAIRFRAGLEDTDAIDRESLLDAILQERRVELFTEMGHRWLDLKRMRKVIVEIAPLKGALWQDTDTLYPIPQRERTSNPNLSQNDGYE